MKAVHPVHTVLPAEKVGLASVRVMHVHSPVWLTAMLDLWLLSHIGPICSKCVTLFFKFM